ncbi:hypothetical protein [Peribacillus frigoritolerans]
MSFFTLILKGWKKFATTPAEKLVAETPQKLALRWLGRMPAEREQISEID